MKNKIKAVSRNSPLAVKQAGEVFSLLPEIQFNLFTLDSYGDKHKEISLTEKIPDDFFTRELDEALLTGEADAAVHSAKDLPYPLSRGLLMAALTPAFDSRDCLVSRGGVKLKDLPAGARIGASSSERQKQIISLRKDLLPVDIRGTIGERLELINTGKIDALAVAFCALKRLGLEKNCSEILPFKTHPLQGMLAVVIKESRKDLKVLFSKIDGRRKYGRVYLVGSGSGDPELLTVKGMKILEKSHAVYYDDLIPKEILDYSRGEKFYVGKRKNLHSYSQSEIQEKLYESALKGLLTVRLKGGDPMIFGRAEEEINFLRSRGVDVEIIPGISASQSAASFYQIPLTERNISDSLAFITASHEKPEEIKTPPCGTLVYYMGSSRLKEISSALLKNGFPKDMPAALIHGMGYLSQKIEIRTVSDMADSFLSSPLIIIIGYSVKNALIRDKILYTGLNPDFIKNRIPGNVFHSPLIEIKERNPRPVIEIEKYHGIILTSRSAVNVFFKNYSLKTNQKIFAIGGGTAHEIEKWGEKSDFISEKPHSASLYQLIQEKKIFPLLYPCSSLSDNLIHQINGVEKKILYDTIEKKEIEINTEEFDGFVFTSPSTVKAFYHFFKEFPAEKIYYYMGPATEKSLLSYQVQKERMIHVQEV